MFIRYEITTKAVHHRSTVPFTMPPDDGEADITITDEAAIGELSDLRVKDDLSGLDVMVRALTPLPPPALTFEDVLAVLKQNPTMAAQLDAVMAAKVV